MLAIEEKAGDDMGVDHDHGRPDRFVASSSWSVKSQCAVFSRTARAAPSSSETS